MRNHAENQAGRLVPDPFLFFKKALYEVKKQMAAAWFQYVSIAFNLAFDKSKLYKTLEYWSRDIPNFELLEK